MSIVKLYLTLQRKPNFLVFYRFLHMQVTNGVIATARKNELNPLEERKQTNKQINPEGKAQ